MATDLSSLLKAVKQGKLSRRGFVRRMLLAGLTAPMATQLLATGGVAYAQPKDDDGYKPTKRGGGGVLKVLWWQAPTLLNPHFAIGTKDQDASRIFYQPLAGWDPEGNLIPSLAAEIPSKENGGLAEDGKSVTWKLKQGVKWHDGQPFTADDCVFNWEYGRDPATAAVTIGKYQDVKVEKVDEHTVKVIFPQAQPFWADTFVGNYGCLIPKHLFKDFMGAKSREAPTNLSPVGTGPYKFKEFRPGDMVAGTINMDYHEANKPYFDEIQMKGGGDAVSAARAVLQTGEFDYAWNLQVEDDVLSRLEKGGGGHVYVSESPGIEHIQCNFTDPSVEVDGERSSLKTKHPTLTDPAVREALNYLLERNAVQKYIYGRGGVATANFVNVPKKYGSTNTTIEFSIEKAVAVLEKAGWKPGGDGIREKDGKKLKFVFQTSINQPRQKTQQVFKQACQKAGIDLELKSVVASVYFSSDVANPDTYSHFYTDLQMYNTTADTPDPGLFLRAFYSTETAQKANKWQGRNITRWQSKEYDAAWDKQQYELDPIKRAQLLIECNDLACKKLGRAAAGVSADRRGHEQQAARDAERVREPDGVATELVEG